jgi:hypothetical protein
MRRTIAAVACGLAVLGGVGCQSFSYVQRNPNGGVIELKASEQEAAIAKLKEQEGDIEIEQVVMKGKPGQPFDPKAPVQQSDRMAATASSGFGSLFASSDEGKVQIQYRKKAGGMTPPGGLPPAREDGVVQTGYQSKSQYDRPGVGAAAVGGAKPAAGGVDGPLPAVNFNGMKPNN